MRESSGLAAQVASTRGFSLIPPSGAESALTVMRTLTVLLTAAPSEARYVNESDPVYPEVGTYVTFFVAGSTVAVPCDGLDCSSTVRTSPSTSVSFASTSMAFVAPDFTVAASAVATGASFTGVTVMVTAAPTDVVPSVTTYPKVSVPW